MSLTVKRRVRMRLEKNLLERKALVKQTRLMRWSADAGRAFVLVRAEGTLHDVTAIDMRARWGGGRLSDEVFVLVRKGGTSVAHFRDQLRLARWMVFGRGTPRFPSLVRILEAISSFFLAVFEQLSVL